MANIVRVSHRVEWDGANFTVWAGNILIISTNSPKEFIAACKGVPVAPRPNEQPAARSRLETAEEYFARGGKVRRVRATPLGFELDEDALEAAFAEEFGTAKQPTSPPNSPQK